ncbi:hypothetical protein ACS0TY_023184 [Phlomoides rotata]
MVSLNFTHCLSKTTKVSLSKTLYSASYFLAPLPINSATMSNTIFSNGVAKVPRLFPEEAMASTLDSENEQRDIHSLRGC